MPPKARVWGAAGTPSIAGGLEWVLQPLVQDEHQSQHIGVGIATRGA